MKGLVSLRKSLAKCSPLIKEGPIRSPVNKQAALIIRKAPEQFKPMPSDPDLADRKVVVAYLKERNTFMAETDALKLMVRSLRKDSQSCHEKIKELKGIIEEMKASGKPITVELETEPSIPREIQALGDKELITAIEEIAEARRHLIDTPKWSWRVDSCLKRSQEACAAELQRRTKAL